MFDYNENNLYDRCGAINVPHNPNIKPESTGKCATVAGEEIPIIDFGFQSGVRFTRCICLKTFLGYIPIDNINSIKDIFKKNNYLTDETEWIFNYCDSKPNQEDKEKVKRLSFALGKHWKSY